MHYQAYDFTERMLPKLGEIEHVLEVGSRNVNGSVRPLFANATSYTGIDILDGPGVDVVVTGYGYEPAHKPSVVVCCEVLEHTEQALAIVRNAAAILKLGGRLLVTCATDPRMPHSGIHGGPLEQGEFYRNVPPDILVGWVEQAGLHVLERETYPDRGDLYLLAGK
jgi:hypothetical protein